MAELLVHTPITVLKGVGPAVAEKLAKVGLENLQDVLFHLPSRYQDRTRITPIGVKKLKTHQLLLKFMKLKRNN